eukprot:TRINITY_DN78992_c0_g1_i1.p1 TRINITY_DN78992_c0_g1~~TRINITY_DN78992_c0_g1_i1.p1  ORF type:complete len:656 (-),score=96.25 TRINITY_DN78992_c0_g1_i1:74-2041(-)
MVKNDVRTRLPSLEDVARNGWSKVLGYCWAGSFTRQRCCLRRDETCFDDFHTPERCCDVQANRSATWWGGTAVLRFSHLALFHLSAGTSCMLSPSLDRDFCCSSPVESYLGYSCFDGVFSRKRCCGHITDLSSTVLPIDKASCWSGGFNEEVCCESAEVGEQLGCWDGHYNFESCCSRSSSSIASALWLERSSSKLLTFEEARQNSECSHEQGLERCSQLWQAIIADAPTLSEPQVQSVAEKLATDWLERHILDRLVSKAAGFVLSVVLHAVLAMVDRWLKDANHFPAWRAEDPMAAIAVEMLQLYRKSFHLVEQHRLSSKSEEDGLRIADLDEAIRRGLQSRYHVVLDRVLYERITELQEGPNKALPGFNFNAMAGDSFNGAFGELLEVLHVLKLDYVPVQGTLISLLRYGSFPHGRLESGKWDVVDNDAEVLVMLTPGETVDAVGLRISLFLEAKGWPPCINPHFQKLVCFSLQFEVPCKVEIYFAKQDPVKQIIFTDRTCFQEGNCTYRQAFPLQYWEGQMPMEIVFPYSSCRLGEAWRHALCPNNAVEMLRHWNSGEYQHRRDKSKAEGVDDDWCVALPVMSKDRDFGNKENMRLKQEGLSLEDLRLLQGYARALHWRGFASFYLHLRDLPCLRRQQQIISGGAQVGLTGN